MTVLLGSCPATDSLLLQGVTCIHRVLLFVEAAKTGAVDLLGTIAIGDSEGGGGTQYLSAFRLRVTQEIHGQFESGDGLGVVGAHLEVGQVFDFDLSLDRNGCICGRLKVATDQV